MSQKPETETYVERVPIPLDQPTIAWLASLERDTGEPAAIIAGRILSEVRAGSKRADGRLH
jgi:hypothetical protein